MSAPARIAGISVVVPATLDFTREERCRLRGVTHVLSEVDFARLSLSDRLSGLAKAKVA